MNDTNARAVQQPVGSITEAKRRAIVAGRACNLAEELALLAAFAGDYAEEWRLQRQRERRVTERYAWIARVSSMTKAKTPEHFVPAVDGESGACTAETLRAHIDHRVAVMNLRKEAEMADPRSDGKRMWLTSCGRGRERQCDVRAPEGCAVHAEHAPPR